MDKTTRVIVTKRKTYTLPEDAEGNPIDQAWSKAAISDSLRGTKVYQTEDGPVIARPWPDKKV
jgi:hypothetical protein